MTDDRLRGALGFLEATGRVWSTGAFIQRDRRLLFAGAAAGGELVVFGVGGRPEAGETLLGALLREGVEEAGVDLEPCDSPSTCVDIEGSGHEMVILPRNLGPRPALVWTGVVSVHGVTKDYVTAVWETTFRGRPRPGAEIRVLLWVDEDDVAAGRWIPAKVVGGEVPPGSGVRVTGSASRAPVWIATRGRGPADGLEDALDRGLELMSRYGAPPGLWHHSSKVALVAVAIGRRALASGHDIDLPGLALAALCHDIGKTPEAAGIGGADHARVSETVLLREGLGGLARAVGSHMLPTINEPGLGEDMLTRIVFYADKVVRMEYVGIEERLDELAGRRPELAGDIEPARGPLRVLERELAAAVGLPVERLRLVCGVAALSEVGCW